MMSWLIFLPAAGFVALLAFPRTGPLVAPLISLGSLLLTLRLTFKVLTEGPAETLLGGGLVEVSFRCDGLSAILLLATAVIFAAVSVYNLSLTIHTRNRDGRNSSSSTRSWPLALLLLSALNGIYLSTHLVSIFMFVEIMGAAAVLSAAFSRRQRSAAAAMRYFFTRLPGSLAFLLGCVLLLGAEGSLNLARLGETLQPSPLSALACALILLGVLVKAALFPLHSWLPPAHSGATAPLSALLSGAVVKAPFYLAIRFWLDLFPAISTVAAAQAIGALGALGILWGAIQALRQEHLKLLIAHSTVSQMGFLLLLFPLVTGGGNGEWVLWAWTGGIYQAVAHALAKAAMLLAAGIVLYSIGTDRLNDLRGMASRLPMTSFTLALASVTLIGLPPSGGFIGKWLLLKAAIGSGQWWWVPVLALGGLLTAGYSFKLIACAFHPREGVPDLKPPPKTMEVAALTLALIALLIGLRVEEATFLIGPEVPTETEVMP
jgi:multicomponent Na+:H+ antiporter subunit D